MNSEKQTWLSSITNLLPEDLEGYNKNVTNIYERYEDKMLEENKIFWKTLRENITEEKLKETIDNLDYFVEYKNLEGYEFPGEITLDDNLLWIKKRYDEKADEITKNFWIECDSFLSIEDKDDFLNWSNEMSLKM